MDESRRGIHCAAMSNLKITHRLALPLGGLVLSPVVWAGAPQAYITNLSDGTVSVIDTASNTVMATVPVGNFPNGVAVTPDGAHVYVANVVDGTVSVIETAGNTVTATVPVGLFPFGVAVTPDGAHVYVANQGGGNVSVIATASNTVTATVTVGPSPTGVAVTPDGTRVYVANFNADTISVIATASNTVTATVTVGANPAGVAVTPDGARVYVANQNSNNVAMIATASNTVTATVLVGNAPRAFGKFISSSGDATPPVTSLAAQPGTLKGRKLMTANATLTVSPGGLTIQTRCFDSFGLNVLLSATDDSSGVAQINYGSAHFVLGQQPPNPALDQSIASASGTIPFPTTGVFALNYSAVDRAGNQEAAKSALVMVNSFKAFACATQPFALAALPSSATVTVSGTLTNGSKTKPFRFKFKYEIGR